MGKTLLEDYSISPSWDGRSRWEAVSLIQINDPDFIDFWFYDILDLMEPYIFECEEDEEEEWTQEKSE